MKETCAASLGEGVVARPPTMPLVRGKAAGLILVVD